MAMVKAQIPEGYATIRRSKSRAKKFRCTSTSSNETTISTTITTNHQQPQHFEMIDMNERNSINRKFESDIVYSNGNIKNKNNDIFNDDDEGVINDIETDGDVFLRNNIENENDDDDIYGTNNKRRTFQTFKPKENIGSNVDVSQQIRNNIISKSSRDLSHSNDYIQSLPYDLLMSPLKSPQYINQLNAMRNNNNNIINNNNINNTSKSIAIINGNDAAVRQQQFPLYSRPDSPKYIKLFNNNRSTSPSADSMDNCSSNSSTTYSPAYLTNQQLQTITTTQITSFMNQDDDNLILIDSRKPPTVKSNSSLGYRKSFSHINRAHHQQQYTNGNSENNNINNRRHNGSFMSCKATNSQEFINGFEKPSISTLTMTKSLAMPSISTSNLYTRQRFATLAHPKEKSLHGANTKSTSSLNESHVYWDPVLDSKIGSQTTLRHKPAIPWWEIACKKEYRQSCPPMQESEITDMRQTIELLKKQSIQAGLTSAHIESMGVKMNVNGNGSPTKKSINGSHESGLQNGNGTMQRQLSTDSVCSINSLSSNCSMQDKKKKKGWLRSSFTKAFSRNAKISKTNRQMSLNGNLSESKASLPPPTQLKMIPKLPTTNTVPDLGKPPISPTKLSNRQVTLIENAKPFDSIEVENHPIVEELKKQLREKDMVLTDIRLEALTQASQMETLKETVKAMRQEMMALRQNNDRLQKMVTSRSLAGSETSIGCPASPCSAGDSRRYSFATDSGHSRPPLDLPDNLDETEEEDEVPTPAPAPLSPHLMNDISPTLERISLSHDVLATPGEEISDSGDGKRISIAVYLGQAERYTKYMEELSECEHFNDVEDGLQHNSDNLKFHNHFNHSLDDPNNAEMIIACTYISGKTTWQNLDYIVRKTFKDYLSRVDPGTNLGLNTDSITSYHLGEAKRGPEMGFPELLPCGYIIGNVKSLYICLQGVGSLAFDTLIPRSIVHRYINLLTEHRRLILCGPKGTGKSHLARKLAEFLVAKSNRSPAESIATFNVDHKSSKDLQHYLSQIAEQASINCSMEELPAVIILDNLHHASELGDVFSCLLSAGPASKLPCIIGTMSQATCNTTNLQLHHNFRWVLTANHMEPVKGFLGRFLRRRLYDIELLNGSPQIQMEKIFRWLPTLVQHINSFLETHSSSDVTIGPQLFLECPIDVNDSQKWFLDLWNITLAPYMINAIKEGVQLYGRRGNAWTDPCLYIRETYPWPITPSTVPKLKTITAQDVGLEEAELLGSKEDPLLNMLNQLKEAASWNEIQQDDSDCVSLDSNFTHDSSVAEN